VDATRIDRWLWSVRLCSTRSEATEVCRAGHVRCNGRTVKAASPVAVGDRIEARVHGRDRVVEVTRVIDRRVGAPIAAECYVDHSPPRPDPIDEIFAQRDRGTGRPTKQDRRQLDRLRRRFF
jgi:ribosome-associated heat shock protein Hsp15